jgi:hypothetical protein
MIVAKLIGEADGYIASRQFPDLRRAKQWARGAGLVDFGDQTARGEAWDDGNLRWFQSGLHATKALARWGIVGKKGA